MRPSWDEYFMKLVDDVATRSTCNRGKPGCVFVLNNHILTTGYAGSPQGLPHCDEAGHLMERRFDLISVEKNSGKSIELRTLKSNGYLYDSSSESSESWMGPVHDHCIRTIHAEQNAIIQAAKYGISLNGSTLYVSFTPCRTCAMMCIAVGVKEVIAGKFYSKAQEAIDLFKQAGISIKHLDQNIIEYPK
jgi:dCMP deaminase